MLPPEAVVWGRCVSSRTPHLNPVLAWGSFRSQAHECTSDLYGGILDFNFGLLGSLLPLLAATACPKPELTQ